MATFLFGKIQKYDENTLLVKKINQKYIFFIALICSYLTSLSFAQENDSIIGAYRMHSVEVRDPFYARNYAYTLEMVRKIYPYALYAKSLLDRYNEDVKTLDKKKQIKKYGKTALEKLKEDFEYTLRNMFTSEGQLLMKLINRETGITVFDIIKKYRGASSAGFYTVVGKLFDQDLKIVYDPKQDWLVERVINDIKKGKYALYKMDLLDKTEFKTIKKNEKATLKSQHKAIKEAEKEKKQSRRE